MLSNVDPKKKEYGNRSPIWTNKYELIDKYLVRKAEYYSRDYTSIPIPIGISFDLEFMKYSRSKDCELFDFVYANSYSFLCESLTHTFHFVKHQF